MPFNTLRRHKILTVIAALFALLLIAIVGIIIFSEPIVRSLTQSEGSKRLGRELAIDGALAIDWHWTYTAVHVEKIRLGNAPGYREPNMVTVETLDFTFKPLKLLIGRLEFGDITLTRPYVVLERKSPDDANWHFPALSKANAASEVVLAEDRHDVPLIGKLTLKNGRVIFRDAIKNMHLDLTLDSVTGDGGAKTKGFEKGFNVAGTGTLQNQKFTIEAMGGSLATLRDSNKEFPLNVKLLMGKTSVLVNGTFKDPIQLTGINAALNISGDNLADLFYLTAIPLPPTPPYTLEGQLTKTKAVWGYHNFKGKVGGSDLSGNLSYDTGGKRGFLKADLVSQVMNSEDLGGFIGLPPSSDNAAPEQKQAAAAKKASTKLIPDVPLKLERLRATDLDVTLKAAKIDAPTLPFKGMEVRFDLRDGVLKLNPLKVVLADGTIDGTIDIDARPDIPPMKMNLNLRKLSLGQFFADTRFAKTTQGFFGGTVVLAGTGASLAEVLGTSNGKLAIIMSGGKISQLLIEASDLDIGQALPLFVGKDKSTTIRCGVADFAVTDGVLASKVVVLDTNDSLLVGNVGIDLKREVINARLDAKPKDNSLLALRIPITLSGQLKQPAIGLEGKKAVNRSAIAVVLGTLITPFAAILPFIESGDAKNADCRTLIDNATKNTGSSSEQPGVKRE